MSAICCCGQSGEDINWSVRRCLPLSLPSVASVACAGVQISPSKLQCGKQQASLKSSISCLDLVAKWCKEHFFPFIPLLPWIRKAFINYAAWYDLYCYPCQSDFLISARVKSCGGLKETLWYIYHSVHYQSTTHWNIPLLDTLHIWRIWPWIWKESVMCVLWEIICCVNFVNCIPEAKFHMVLLILQIAGQFQPCTIYKYSQYMGILLLGYMHAFNPIYFGQYQIHVEYSVHM